MTRTPGSAARSAGVRGICALAATGLLVGLGGCSPFGGTTEATSPPTSVPEPTRYPGDALAFPVKIEHRYGETEIEAPPTRIVTVGRHDVDTAVSLGLHPVGVADPFGTDQPYGDWPWAPGVVALADPPNVAGPDGIDFDAIAALKPDLITAVYSDLTEADYQHLTEIADTIAQPPDVPDLQSSWQEETRMIGAAVGRVREAERVVTETEGRFQAARTAHPEFGDANVALVTYDADGALRLVDPYEPRARFLASLGMRFPHKVDAKVGDERFDAEIDLGDLDELGRLDALVWLADPTGDIGGLAAQREVLENDPRYLDLPVVDKGGSVFLTESAAVAFASSISLAYAAEQNTTALARALRSKAEADSNDADSGLLPGEKGSGSEPKKPKATRTPKPTPTPTSTPTPGLTLPPLVLPAPAASSAPSTPTPSSSVPPSPAAVPVVPPAVPPAAHLPTDR